MRAILVDAPNRTPYLSTVADPDLPPHGALVEVRATGVCRSDWHAWVGHDDTVRFPHVPGHEYAGVVRAVGAEVRRFRGGERVTAPFCCGCGACPECDAGHQNLCRHEYQLGFDGWGSFAEVVIGAVGRRQPGAASRRARLRPRRQPRMPLHYRLCGPYRPRRRPTR